MVERDGDALALTVQAALLGLSRRSLYYQPAAPPPEEVAIKHRIDERSTAHPLYGSRKLTVLLAEQFGPINRKRVQRYMREMGIAGIAPGPNLSKRAQQHRISPYLLQGVTAAVPNLVWGSDITYVRLRSNWLYLVAVLDWYSRYVVSWALDDTLALPFVLAAASQALATATPQIWKSDRPAPASLAPSSSPIPSVRSRRWPTDGRSSATTAGFDRAVALPRLAGGGGGVTGPLRG